MVLLFKQHEVLVQYSEMEQCLSNRFFLIYIVLRICWKLMVMKLWPLLLNNKAFSSLWFWAARRLSDTNASAPFAKNVAWPDYVNCIIKRHFWEILSHFVRLLKGTDKCKTIKAPISEVARERQVYCKI